MHREQYGLDDLKALPPGKQDVKKRETSLSHERLRANRLLINHLSTAHNPDAHTARFTTQRGPYGNAKRAMLNRKTPLTTGRHQHSKHFSSTPQPAGTAVDTMPKAGLASGIAHSRNAGDTNPELSQILITTPSDYAISREHSRSSSLSSARHPTAGSL